MRWIKHEKGKVKRGKDIPAMDGDMHFVDGTGSMAIIDGKFYRDGKLAAPGRHKVKFDKKEISLNVDKSGKARRDES